MKLILLVLIIVFPILAAPPFDTILYGASYYPEYMPYERVDKDIELMKRANLSVVRLGESTWSSWEPQDGEFQFAWMDRVIDKLHAAGIKVILGTPTYSIPPWLYKEHPDIVVTHNGTAPPMTDPYRGTYTPAIPPGAYGPRQNMDLTHPYYRRYAERIIRKLMEHYKDHPAIIGYQIDNETGSNGLALPNVQRAFVERLQEKYGTPDKLNRYWGLAYWGQLVQSWDEFPSREGILNPGYKLEWARFQQDIVTQFLGWQAAIVREYKRPDQFITHDFVGGIPMGIYQPAIARKLDVAAVNPYYTMQDRFDGAFIALTGDWVRSLKKQPYLVTETNAQAIGWDSRAQFPPYNGQLRLAVFANVASGATMVAYWHWASLHYGQETYWKGVLSHDLEPNRVYGEVSKIGAELKKLGPSLAGLKKENRVAILMSSDSFHAIQSMPFNDRVDYMTVLTQMHQAMYELNVEADFVVPEETDWSAYRVLLVPPLYSAPDALLTRIADFVRQGGHVVMGFKSGFTNEYSTVRWTMAPGPLREAAGIRYQEFTNLAKEVRLTPDVFTLGEKNAASVWAELLIAEKAQPVLKYQSEFLAPYPAVTRNAHGKGTLTYEGTYLSDELQREIVRDALKRAGLTGSDQSLPAGVKVRHGRNARGQRLHFYLNMSGKPQAVSYAYGDGSDITAAKPVARGAQMMLPAWGVAIVAEGK
jgi:beta-galactosidase